MVYKDDNINKSEALKRQDKRTLTNVHIISELNVQNITFKSQQNVK